MKFRTICEMCLGLLTDKSTLSPSEWPICACVVCGRNVPAVGGSMYAVTTAQAEEAHAKLCEKLAKERA